MKNGRINKCGNVFILLLFGLGCFFSYRAGVRSGVRNYRKESLPGRIIEIKAWYALWKKASACGIITEDGIFPQRKGWHLYFMALYSEMQEYIHQSEKNKKVYSEKLKEIENFMLETDVRNKALPASQANNSGEMNHSASMHLLGTRLDVSKPLQVLLSPSTAFFWGTAMDTATQKNAAANELFSLPELPDGVVAGLARMFRSADEDEVWRDYCLQFLGSALERETGVTDADRALARETLVAALETTNATFAGTALRALHRGAPSDPLVASNALRIAGDSAYPAASRTAALLILEECSAFSDPSTLSSLVESILSDPAPPPHLRSAAEAVRKRLRQ